MSTPYNPGGPVSQGFGGYQSPGDGYFRYNAGARGDSLTGNYPVFRTGAAPNLFQPSWSGGGYGFDQYYDTGGPGRDVFGGNVSGGISVTGQSDQSTAAQEQDLLASILERNGMSGAQPQTGIAPWMENAIGTGRAVPNSGGIPDWMENAIGTARPAPSPLGNGGRGGIYGASGFASTSTGGNFGYAPGGGGRISDTLLSGLINTGQINGDQGIGNFGPAGSYEVASHPGYAH